MFDIRNLAIAFGEKSLFHDVNLNLQRLHRYGVVGANGTGKSTFIKLLAREELPSTGMIDQPKNISIGLLKQDHFHYEQERVIDVVIRGNARLWTALVEKNELLNKETLTESDGYRLAKLEETISHENGYNADAIARTLLQGLGIDNRYHDGPLNALSGGYKLRVLLAQVLFQNPDVMLLDEPTNHLDIVSIAWLEEFLKNDFNGLLIFISHDREFLNNLSTDILDIDYGTITQYVGSYEQFVLAKEQTLLQKQNELQYKEKQIEAMQRYADRFRASASKSRQALSRLKMIDRIELPEIKDSSVIKPFFNFVPKKLSGKSVLRVEHVSKSFTEKPLLHDVSFNLHRGEKCAIIGPNGIGKSTLLKILINDIQADNGSFTWSDTVSHGYFAQDYRTKLPGNQSIWEWLEHQVSATAQEMRNILGQVLFRGQDIEKKISILSGGESARLVLASLILQHDNLLILDEPTNHLDLESIDALVEALQKFPGAILFVSHNRYFIDHVATRVLAITHHGIKNYLGNYHDYLAQYGKDYLSRY